MKKLAFIFAALLAVVVAGSCGKQQALNNDDADSLREADSLAELRQRDSAMWVGFTSKDLAFFGVHGHVKTLIADGSVYEFDTLGTWSRINGVDPFHHRMKNDESDFYYTRNESGYVAGAVFWEYGEEYVWTDGRLTGMNGTEYEYQTHTSYEYDSLGNVSATTMVESENEGKTWTKPNRVQYKYTAFDACRNWTARKSVNGADYRFIDYYSRNAEVEATQPAFDPWQRQYVFVGNVGDEKRTPLALSPKGGLMVVYSGTHFTDVLTFDKGSGRLVVEVRDTDTEQKVGELNGVVSANGKNGFRYKGTYRERGAGSKEFSLVTL